MLTYAQLTEEQQKAAVDYFTTELLRAVIKGDIRFNDSVNGDALQARIDAACEKAEKMRTPWFSHEYILDTCRKDLESMSRCDAEEALYSEAEVVVPLSKLKAA